SLQKQINKLPTLNRKEIEGLGLSKQTVTELKNVIAVTNKYNKEFGFKPNQSSNKKLLSQQIQEIKEELATTGVKVSDTVKIPEIKKTGQTFNLTIPEAFKVQELSLTINNEKIDYHYSNGTIKLPSMEKLEFKFQLKLQLKDTSEKIDVFQPVAWNWDMDLKDINDEENPDDITETTNIQEPDMPLVAKMSTNGSDKDGAQKKPKDELEDDTTENDSPEEEIEQPESTGGNTEEDKEDGESNPENEPEKDESEDEIGRASCRER